MQFPSSNDSDDLSGIESHSLLDSLNQLLHLDTQHHAAPSHFIPPNVYPEQTTSHLPTPDLDSLDHSHHSISYPDRGDHPLVIPSMGSDVLPLLETNSWDRLMTPQDAESSHAPDPLSLDIHLIATPHLQNWDAHSHPVEATNLETKNALELGARIFRYTESGAITPEDSKAVHFIGNDVWWNGYGCGQAGTISGHQFYRNGDCIGRLGADLKVYDAASHYIGYVTPKGDAYTTSGRLFATGGTVRWAAATLVFNTCTEY